MHGPTCIFWANLTPFSSKYLTSRRKANPLLGAGAFLPKTLEELALFNLAHKDEELQVFGQEVFESSLKTAATTTQEEYAAMSAGLRQVCQVNPYRIY
jgi:hypothetical protein